MIEKYEGLYLHSLNLILHKYQHYSELHYNILIIIFQITNSGSLEPERLLDAAQKLGLDDFRDNFSIYRGKIKTFSKMLNNLHLNILAIFSELQKHSILKTPEKRGLMIETMKQVFVDLRSFYKETKHNKKRIDDFKNNKFTEVDIHEIICRIFCNLTKLPETLNQIGSEESIIDDVFEFLSKIANVKKDNHNNYVKSLFENGKRKKRSPEELKRILLSIVDNTVLGIRNMFIEGDDMEFKSKFFLFIDKKFSDKEKGFDQEMIFGIFSGLEATLKEHGIVSVKIPKLVEEIKNKLALL